MNSSSKIPAIVIWLKIYCLVMAIGLGILVALCSALILAPEEALKNDPSLQQNREAALALARFFGFLFVALFGCPLPFLVMGLLWPRRRSGYPVGIMAIIAGFLTPFGWLATVPLLLFWMRPNVRFYYRGPEAASPQAAPAKPPRVNQPASKS